MGFSVYSWVKIGACGKAGGLVIDRSIHAIVVAAAFALLSGRGIAAQSATLSQTYEYSTPVDHVLSKAFPMVELSDCSKEGEKISSNMATIEISDRIHIRGTSAAGTKWSAAWDYAPVFGCGIYRADLDRNGREDLIVLIFSNDSTGSYRSSLTILRMDKDGQPHPWRILGSFRADEHGVAEIALDTHGNTLILDAVQIGHPAWDGVSKGYALYRIEDGRIEPVKGSYQGFSWPYLPKENPKNAELAKMLGQQDISVQSTSAEAEKTTNQSPVRVLRYGVDEPKKNDIKPLEIPPGQYPTVDIAAIDAAKEHLVLSDGSKLDLPAILILDRADRSREIVFDPEVENISELWKSPFTVRSMGTQCSDADDCQPFLFWATADPVKAEE
jgi:hypothetical protein